MSVIIPVLLQTRTTFSLVLVFAALMFTGCDTNSEPSNLAADPETLQSDTAALGDAQFIQLSGSVAPLERLNLVLPTEDAVVLLKQVSTETPIISISQPALRTDSGQYTALAMPSGVPYMMTRDISAANTPIGQINMLALPDGDSGRTPGEYALAAMNSVLFGLRGEMSKLQEFTQNITDASVRLVHEEKILLLQESIDAFQENIRLVDDVVAFNVPIVDTSSNEPVLNGQALVLLDSVFRMLMARLAEDSLFLDGSSVAAVITTGYDNLTFEQFSQSAKIRLGSMDGVRALATLTLILHRSESDLTEPNIIADTVVLKNALSIAQAGLLPAIVTNVAGPITANTSSDHAMQAVSLLIETERVTGNTSNFFYNSALESLFSLATDLAILEQEIEQ